MVGKALVALATCVMCAAFAGPAVAAQRAGVQTHLLWSDVTDAQVGQQLDEAAAVGAKVVRVDVGWSTLEPDRKGEYAAWYLAKMDNVVAQAETRGIEPLFTFWTTPCWASSAPAAVKQSCAGAWWDRGVDRYPPVNASDYADALAFVVRRYGARVPDWEIWNEPNLPEALNSQTPMADYARIVKAAYPAAKAAGAKTVIAGSLANADFADTEALYRDYGLKGYFDAFSVHPYSGDRSPLDPYQDQYKEESFVRGVPAVHDVMVKYGDPKPLWLTEFGWSTCDHRSGPSWDRCVDQQTQATHLAQAYNQMRSWSYVPVGIWYELKNMGSNDSNRLDNYGLVRADELVKPSYPVFPSSSVTGLLVGTPQAP
jgi:polysaccharide biosynthesis protein PslG